MVKIKKAGAYNPLRKQLANPLRYGPYEFKDIHQGVTVSNPTTQFWNVAHGPPITLDIIREVQTQSRTLESLADLRR